MLSERDVKRRDAIDTQFQDSSFTNPNSDWVNSRGAWITNVFLVVITKLLFSVIPFINNEASWTLTNLSYMLGSFFMFHWIRGVPFEFNQGAWDDLTLWEQIDHGMQFTPTRKFLTAFPIVLFLLSTHYTHYDVPTFVVNLVALVVVLIAKLPSMDRVRLFGINEHKPPADD